MAEMTEITAMVGETAPPSSSGDGSGVTGGTGMLCDDRGQTATQTALLEQLLAALVALHADIPTMLQALGIELDGREVGRLVRKYANA